MEITLTINEARRFLLYHHGLLGEYRYHDKQGVYSFIESMGCIQYDPIDVCGKNPELVLQSRVKGFKKRWLYELLYQDRLLIDYFDKQLSILPAGNWPHLTFTRQHNSFTKSQKEIDGARKYIKEIIAQKGPVCSAQLDMKEKVNWYWGSTKLSRAALEALYFAGELVIHHKKGTIKYYDLAENHIPDSMLQAKNPFESEYAYQKWAVLRRIQSLGFLWNRPSDAFLGIINLKAAARKQIFADLLAEGNIKPLFIKGINEPFYYAISAEPEITFIRRPEKRKERCEFIAPLDNLLWDRKLIKQIFNFDYKWEIYTPESERKYGYYVLPILLGDRFVGRIELISDRKSQTLVMKAIWLEDKIRMTQKLSGKLKAACKRFMRFHDFQQIQDNTGYAIIP